MAATEKPQTPGNSTSDDDKIDMSDLVTAQALSLAVQDQVDEFRNRSVIKNTVRGSTYAKWLANPVMSPEYKQILASLDNDHEPPVPEPSPKPAPEKLMVSLINLQAAKNKGLI